MLEPRPIRVLTLHRPWGWAFFHLPEGERKELENRSWAPSPLQLARGERFALHHGKKWDAKGAAYIEETLGLPGLPREAQQEGVLGTVRYGGVIAKHQDDCFPDQCPPGQEQWYFGPYAWKTTEAFGFLEPIPCRGAQGLWRASPELAERIRRFDPRAGHVTEGKAER